MTVIKRKKSLPIDRRHFHFIIFSPSLKNVEKECWENVDFLDTQPTTEVEADN
jgi:hypothetical protein